MTIAALITFLTGKAGVTLTGSGATYVQFTLDTSKISHKVILDAISKVKGYVVTDGSYKSATKKYRVSTTKAGAVLA